VDTALVDTALVDAPLVDAALVDAPLVDAALLEARRVVGRVRDMGGRWAAEREGHLTPPGDRLQWTIFVSRRSSIKTLG
jgi:hypothetical protein